MIQERNDDILIKTTTEKNKISSKDNSNTEGNYLIYYRN